MPDNDYVAILDFGSQYTQLIARRTREASVYCEILTPDARPEDLKKHRLKGVILSGGPASVYQKKAPSCDPKIFDLNVPILDRKSTRLNSSHLVISYAVFCL